MALSDQRVEEHTTHLNEKNKRFSIDYEELRRVIIKMRTPSYWHHGPDDNNPPPLVF